MELHRVVQGEGPRVVLVHGFTQTHVSWRHVARSLAVDHEVVSVDAPGHGGSSAVAVDLAGGAAMLARAGGEALYVGYSMGGRLALRTALDHPASVAGLVLVGATAGIDDPDERAARRRSDEDLARRLEEEGVARFLEGWLALPLFAGLPDDPEERAARAANTSAGLASSLRLAGTGTMDPPWWDELSRIEVPVVALAGELDARFAALGRRLAALVGPTARFEVVPGAGHAAHLHDPDAVAGVVRRVVAQTGEVFRTSGGRASRG